ncbi:hypothetical protein ATANTOWER_025607 [Ataeniobius toweri]|uniref:Uncharacterized protein n=1 Tax=Ataeniobius toweri TaxID=208326 RepID=A0ABU7C0H4_9TELE|nr:hypothetical protein [Ataeniobius toweri]
MKRAPWGPDGDRRRLRFLRAVQSCLSCSSEDGALVKRGWQAVRVPVSPRPCSHPLAPSGASELSQYLQTQSPLPPRGCPPSVLEA